MIGSNIKSLQTIKQKEKAQTMSMTMTKNNQAGDVTTTVEVAPSGVQLSPLANQTPVNAVAAQGTLTISGVVIAGETVTIGGASGDVYEFDASGDYAGDNIEVDISSYANQAKGTLTMDVKPTADDTVTIGENVYKFVVTPAAEGDVAIGDALANSQENLVAAINDGDDYNDPHPLVTIGDFSSDDAIITAIQGGTAGNAIATTETFSAETNVFDAATLGTTQAGTACSAANAVTALVAAITSDDTQGVGAADGAGDTVVLTADTKGVLGNAIATTETMAYGAFDAVTLGTTTAGVDGTQGRAGEECYDSSYHYICVAVNTIVDRNWRRISLGSAY